MSGKSPEYVLGDIAPLIFTKVEGDPACTINGLATLASAGPGQLTFFTNPAYREQLKTCRASAVIVAAEHASLPTGECSNKLIAEQDPYFSYALATGLFAHPTVTKVAVPGIHPLAAVAEDAEIADDAAIGPHATVESGARIGPEVQLGPGVFVGADCSIGAGSVLYSGVTLYHGVHVGENAIIHSGAVIGADGFGFASTGEMSVKIHQLGGVRIGEKVEIGACTSIDRGALDDTVIGDGVKIDNQVQIGHNCRIGDHSVICGCAALAGSVTLGKHCIMGGGSGAVGHITIADRVQVSAMSLVSGSISEAGRYSSGTGHMKTATWKRNIARFRQLDGMARRLTQLEKAVSPNE